MTLPDRFPPTFAALVALVLALHAHAASAQILTLTETIPDRAHEPWGTVADGRILQSAHSGEHRYQGTYRWSSPPRSVGPEGFSITLSVQCETGAKQTMATGIGISADGLDLVVSAANRAKAETQAPLNCAVGQASSKSITVHVLPRERYREGDRAKLRIGAFWGLGVNYHYIARETGPSGAGVKPASPIAKLEPPSPVTPPVGMRTLGCFKDTPAYDLDGHLERSAQNTPQRCVSVCKSRGFAYAGVQYGESCLCGNSYGRYGPANNCDYPCTGDRGQRCGGYSTNSVYATGNAVPVAKAPPVSLGPPAVAALPPPRDKPAPPLKAVPPAVAAIPPAAPIAKAAPSAPPPGEQRPPAPPAMASPPVMPVTPAPAPRIPGDCDGDGRVTAFDARCALEMSVQLIPVQLALDIDDSRDVTSRDASLILQRALGR